MPLNETSRIVQRHMERVAVFADIIQNAVSRVVLLLGVNRRAPPPPAPPQPPMEHPV
jgi:hypothetical protein